ncbi:multisubstrate pseudouridine synthase 7 [Kappamyces sp. JEL0829]|nr:multisubstrate pseudouridine synthase 7 [Kappamyces sp. JEL0829]
MSLFEHVAKKTKMDSESVVGAASHQERSVATHVLTEANVGIKCYMSPCIGRSFTGIIKHRYNDFHVQELDREGNAVHLTTLAAPKYVKTPDASAASALLPRDEKCSLVAQAMAQPEFAARLAAFLDDETPTSILSEAVLEKATRTSVHQLCKAYFPGEFETRTENNCILFAKPGGKAQIGRFAPRPSFKELGGEYLHFTLYKENKDTMESVNTLARLVRADSKLFTFCGTKDKRGITTQRVSAHKIHAERLAGLNKSLRGIRVGDFKYERERLQLGDSQGNHFKIAIREVQTKDPQLILDSLETLKSKGFINYFGMQRFGTRSVSTHHVGIAMLQENWQEACEMILGRDDSGDGRDEFNNARSEWLASHDPEQALALYPRYCLAERSILQSYTRQGKNQSKWNHLQAIQSIGRNLRLMYVHSYQSRVWNEMTSLRHEKFGARVVVGDIVRVEKEAGQDDGEDIDGDDANEESKTRRGLGVVKVIASKEEAAQYSIYDIVLPMPGHSVLYPSHEIAAEYKAFMGQDGFDPNKMARKIADINLPGFYRRCYSLPRNVSGRLVRYSDQGSDPVDFIESDLERLAPKKREKEIPNGDLLALVVEFTLSSSEYATMVLREITKTETSASFHSQLSQSSKDHSKPKAPTEGNKE